MKKIQLQDWELDQIKRFKNAVKNSGGRCVIASVKSVSASGMSRKIKFGYIYKGELYNIYHILEIVGYKMNSDGTVTRKGCGMDMIFDTLYGLYHFLGLKDYSSLACHYSNF